MSDVDKTKNYVKSTDATTATSENYHNVYSQDIQWIFGLTNLMCARWKWQCYSAMKKKEFKQVGAEVSDTSGTQGS